MRKIFLLAALVGATTSVMADGLTAKIEGMLNFETGFRKQSKVPAASKNVSSDRRNFAMDSDAHIAATISNEMDMIKYGARVDLQTTTKGSGSSSFSGSHIFTESSYGKWQFGSDFDAGTQMRIDGFNVARGSGDNWTKYAWFDGEADGISWVQTPGASILSGKYRVDNGVETSRKVTYFTPKFADKVQVGVSYIPDTTNLGIASLSSRYDAKAARTIDVANVRYTEKPGAKDAFSVGATFEHEISDGVNIKVALTGEVGKSSAKGTKENTVNSVVVPNTKTEYKVDGMRTYNIGAVLNYGVMSFAGSYADLGKSLTSVEVDGAGKRKTKYYTAAAAYNQGPVGLSVFYTRGQRLKNTVNSYTFGTDYKLAPGFVPYVEVTYFKGKGKQLPVFNNPAKLTRKGTIALIGATLKF
jgi:hypothetical protein